MFCRGCDVEWSWQAIGTSWGGIVVGKEKCFGFNHKILIKIQESSPRIMVTRNLWSARVWVRD